MVAPSSLLLLCTLDELLSHLLRHFCDFHCKVGLLNLDFEWPVTEWISQLAVKYNTQAYLPKKIIPSSILLCAVPTHPFPVENLSVLYAANTDISWYPPGFLGGVGVNLLSVADIKSSSLARLRSSLAQAQRLNIKSSKDFSSWRP